MFGFAKKIGMTRLFVDGKHTPVTVLQIPTQKVIQVKNIATDGYNAIQIGAFPRKKGSNARVGHIKKHTGVDQDYIHIGEFNTGNTTDAKEYTIKDIAENDVFHISGNTIGRGFAGAIKRHGFHGQPSSHGHDHKRAVGSIGTRWPQRVLPGKKMAGHYGASQQTIRNARVVAIDAENNLIFVHGSLPGANSSVLKISKVN